MGSGASSTQQAVSGASDAQALEALTALYLLNADRASMLVEAARTAAVQAKDEAGQGAAPAAPPETVDWAAFQAELVSEHNMARERPTEYAESRVRPMLAKFDGKRYNDDSGGATRVLLTQEGRAPVDDLLQALADHAAAPCGPLALERGLCSAAQRHAADLGYSGGMDHAGTDGSTVQTRIEAYGEWWGSCGENISLGFAGARNIVLWLLVDDGVPGRGHRKNILDAKFAVCGCSELREHVKLRQCIVFDYATGFGPKKNVIGVALQAEATGAMNANVKAILDSLPHGLEQLKDEITALLVPESNAKVIIDYAPGSVEAKYITVADGKRSTRTRKATWATESQ